MLNRVLLLSLIATVLFSCTKRKYDFGNFNDEAGPTVGLPLINSSISIEALFKNNDSSSFIQSDTNNLMYVSFKDKLATIQTSDLLDTIQGFNVTQSENIGPIAADGFAINNMFTLRQIAEGMDDPMKSTLLNNHGSTMMFPGFDNQSVDETLVGPLTDFEYMSFIEGILVLEMTNDWTFDLHDIALRLRNKVDNSVIGIFRIIDLPAGTTNTDTIDVVNQTMHNEIYIDFMSLTGLPSTDPILINLNHKLYANIYGEQLVIHEGSTVMPEQEIVNDTLTETLPFTNGEILDEAHLASGKITFSLETTLEQNSKIEISVPELINTTNGNPFSQVVDVIVGSDPVLNIEREWNLEDYAIFFDNSIDTNSIHPTVKATLLSSAPYSKYFDTTKYINTTFSLEGMQIEGATGYLGQTELSLSSTPIDMDFSTGVIPGDLAFEEPSINITLINSFGLPLQTDFSQLSAIHDEDTISFTGSAITTLTDVNYPTEYEADDSISTLISINHENSNIKEILNSSPNGIIPTIGVNMNPDGYTDLNFIRKESKINAYLDVTIPFYATLANLTVKDTMEAGEIMASISPFTPATINLTITNGFPIDLICSLQFVDENYDSLYTLEIGEESMIPSAIVDLRGDVRSTSELATEIVIDKEITAQITEAKYIILDFAIQSPEEGTVPVKFYTTSKLDIVMGIMSTLNLFGKE